MSYESLKNDSDIRWSELNSGNIPWIRISDAMCCGSSLGSEEIIKAIKDFGKKHKMQSIADALATIKKLPDGKQVTDLDYSKIFVSKKKNDVDPLRDG